VLQYYDDNSKPSVIWDDIVRKNISSIPNVTGVAYGTDGTLYVSNSGVSGVSNGTVTEYPAPSTDPVPAKTLSSPNLKSAAGVAVDTSGNVYVADNGFETVSRFPTEGKPVTIVPGWSAGADVNGVAVDTQGHLYVAMTDVGNYQPSGKNKNVGTLAVLPTSFASDTTPKFSIESSASNGVNQPYGVAVGKYGAVFVVNDYVSIVQGPPGPGPIYSTLTRYETGIATSKARPDGTASAGLAWPLGVATDLAGNVYVANNTPPSASGQPGPYYLLEYPLTFVASGAEPASKLDLSAGLPSVYGPYYLNVQGIAVYPTATTK
jgi:sugar lactone lactonase YvrE